LKRIVFFCNKQIPCVNPEREIVEFDDDATEDEITEAFTNWVFDKLDTAYWEAEDGDEV